MTAVFTGAYAGAYDRLYDEKDYDGECNALERMFAEFGAGRIQSVLDLGCGTGSHAVRMARRGYSLTGVDASVAMLDVAERKAEAAGVSLNLLAADLRSLSLGAQFDAVVMMFAVLGYQTTNEDVSRALEVVRKHLRPGGVFIADFWFGPAVLCQRPSDRVRVIDRAGRRTIRTAQPDLSVMRHVCDVHYNVIAIEDDRVVSQDTEEHAMRFFFPLELDALCAAAGLGLTTLRRFPELDIAPSEATWNAALVAQ